MVRGGGAGIAFVEPGYTFGGEKETFKTKFSGADRESGTQQSKPAGNKTEQTEAKGWSVKGNTGVDLTVGIEAGAPGEWNVKDATRAFHENNQLRTGFTPGGASDDVGKASRTVKASLYEAISSFGDKGASLKTIEKWVGPENATNITDAISAKMKEDQGEDFEVNRRDLTFNVDLKLDQEVLSKIRLDALSVFPDNPDKRKALVEKEASSILSKPWKDDNADKVSMEVTANLSKTYSKGLKSGFPFVFTAKNNGSISVRQNFDTMDVGTRK